MKSGSVQAYQPKDTLSLYALIAASLSAVFISDLLAPLGVGLWVFYLAPVAVTILSWQPLAPFLTAGAATVLTTIRFFLSVPDTHPALERRVFGMLTAWIVASVISYSIRGRLAVRRQQWLQSAQTLLSEKMTGEQTIEQLAGNVLRSMAEHLGAQAGAIFVQEDTDFLRCAGYALPSSASIPERVSPGEGLLGQAIKEVRSFVLADVPEGYLAIGSGLGQSRPRHLLIAPAIVDGAAIAVMEFGFFQPVGDAAIEMVTRVSNSVGMGIRSAKYRARLQNLLEETQHQAEELDAQSQELRVSNEELEQQSRNLQESQFRLERQHAELEQTNARLEDQTKVLELQRDELVQAKTALEAQAREIEQASRYKSEFLASMSHELRTPLNSALILARLLAENGSGNLTGEQVEFARNIESAGNALLDLINDVLDLAKVEAGRLEVHVRPAAISKIAETMRSVFAPVARQKNLAFQIRIADDVPAFIETDAQRLEQVLKNLLSNAIKFTEEGEIDLNILRTAGGRVCFAVRDTGIGIPREQQEAVFEPFHQGDGALNRKYGGTGLGLSISRELASLLGGEMRLDSAAGKGSTFSLSIPEQYNPEAVLPQPEELPKAVAAAAGTSATAPVAVPAATPFPRPEDDREKLSVERRIILVVEDDVPFAQILRDLAHELNFQCLIAVSSAEALALAAQYSPDAVILDIGLPDVSGLSVLDRLKSDSRTRHIPVHVVSAIDYAETALSLGAIGYALKPVKREQLIEALQRLEKRLLQKMRRVLIVEDDSVQRESVSRLLASRDVETVGVSSASECLDRLHQTSFDCMVLDLSLPDQSGFSLLETISHEDRYSFPPVIVYTGRDLTSAEEVQLRRYSKSIIIKGAKSPERLLDEVTLFLHEVVAELPAEQQRMIEKARSRDAILEGRQILIAEDDIRNIFALTSLLEPRGARIQVARNGREAIDAIARDPSASRPAIDLVLMDIMMPEMDGLTAIREIRKRPQWKKLPIIALTAKAMKNDQEHAIAAGANDYMAKPFDVDQFLSLVRIWMPR